jgi:hypothetical protein
MLEFLTHNWQVVVLFGSVLLYGFFDFFDKQRVQDEREEWLRLKTANLLQKLNLISITLLSIYLYIEPEFSAYACIQVFILSSLYGEIFGKLYYRFR